MPTKSNEGGTAQDDVTKIRTAMKLIWEVIHSADLGSAHMDAVIDEKSLDGMPPFEKLSLGDWSFSYSDADGFLASYEPYEEQDKWQVMIDPARVESFTMPPLPKAGPYVVGIEITDKKWP